LNDLKQQLAPGWSAVNIGITVILFILSWQLALVMIAYIIWGKNLGLDLSKPATLGTFARRIGVAFKAAINAFKGPSSP